MRPATLCDFFTNYKVSRKKDKALRQMYKKRDLISIFYWKNRF